MKQWIPLLKQCPLFTNIQDEHLTSILTCLGATIISYKKNQVIFYEGDKATHIGIVLSGNVQIIRDDYDGNRSIIASIDPIQLFGESFACAHVDTLPICVIASKESEVMMIEANRISSCCATACSFHNQLILNLLKIVATKNIMFNRKIDITSKRTTREKIMTYLLYQAKLHGSNEFTIDYDRQALADYLEVERSAMSTEIGKLKKDGIIECKKNYFKLLRS